MGNLYLVSTPIGNLKDISFRALEVLKTVSIIVAEDPRVTQKLLHHFQISTPVRSYHQHNESEQVKRIVELLTEGDVALVSDAGTPLISDPGQLLVAEAVKFGVKIIPIPGPTALISALIMTGFNCDKFVFGGFLPKKTNQKIELIKNLSVVNLPAIYYENPSRLSDSLEVFLETLGERQVAIVREITKLYEQIFRGTLTEAVAWAQAQSKLGEVVIIVNSKEMVKKAFLENEVKTLLRDELQAGTRLKLAAKNISKLTGWKTDEVYKLGVKTKGADAD